LGAHTKLSDPLHGKKGFNAAIHQESWDTAWRNLRKAAVDSIIANAAKQNRDLTLAERADIEALSTVGFHSMRHTFITRAAELGVPLATMDQVGDVNEAMTRHYTHIAEQAQRRAVELMDTGEAHPFVDADQLTPPTSAKLLN
jgi:integrase